MRLQAGGPARPWPHHRVVLLVAVAAFVGLGWSAAPSPDVPAPSTQPVAADVDGDRTVVVRYFYGSGCPYCAAQGVELDAWEAALDVEIHRYEVWHDAANRALYAELAAAHGVEARAVPATFIGERTWMGFNDELAADMRAAVEVCSAEGCPDPLDLLAGDTPAEPETSPDGSVAEPAAPSTVRLPLVGTVELARGGVVASTALIAFVDGFNPCSLWVLSILLALLVRTGSRGRLAAVGGTFLAVTALIYGLFIAGAFGTLSYVGHLGWIRGVVAGFALVFAAVSIKDYVRLKQGPSFTIPDRVKPRIYRGGRHLADVERALPAALAATVVMAAGVALVELPCTAGFPVVWSQIVADAHVPAGGLAALLGLYLGIYLLDEVLLLGVVVVTMQVGKVQERHVQVLKLVGGTIMLALGVVMLVRPELLHELTGTLVVFLVAIGVAAAVHTARTLATR